MSIYRDTYIYICFANFLSILLCMNTVVPDVGHSLEAPRAPIFEDLASKRICRRVCRICRSQNIIAEFRPCQVLLTTSYTAD